MKNHSFLLFLLALQTTNILIVSSDKQASLSQSTTDSQESNTGSMLLAALGPLPNNEYYDNDQNWAGIEPNNIHKPAHNNQTSHAQARTNHEYDLSTTNVRINTTRTNHQAAQEAPLSPYSLPSAASSQSTQIDYANVSSQESTSPHQLHRSEEISQQKQGYSYFETISDDDENN